MRTLIAFLLIVVAGTATAATVHRETFTLSLSAGNHGIPWRQLGFTVDTLFDTHGHSRSRELPTHGGASARAVFTWTPADPYIVGMEVSITAYRCQTNGSSTACSSPGGTSASGASPLTVETEFHEGANRVTLRVRELIDCDSVCLHGGTQTVDVEYIEFD